MEEIILPCPRACLRVDLARLIHNYTYLAARLARENTAPIAVVKANAYGHGAIPIAAALYGAGCRRFAVADLTEAVALRDALPPCEILVLGYTPPENAPLAAARAITLTVAEYSYARALSRVLRQRVLPVHIKLNCGMNRMGLRLAPEAFDRSVAQLFAILAMPRLRVGGVYSHLATADDKDANFIAYKRKDKKGKEIIVSGEMQSRKWKDKDGNNRISWELMANGVDFCGSKEKTSPTTENASQADFEPIEDNSDEDLPF